ncbi:hypothetical protein [Streptomyces sp. WG7]|uniref:hypothetical protein n=1 Tax=Streptomyces sp. WG7 TaxID=3417650 RepID=UPI003CE910DC
MPGLSAAAAPEGLNGRSPYAPPLDLAGPGIRSLLTTVLTDTGGPTDRLLCAHRRRRGGRHDRGRLRPTDDDLARTLNGGGRVLLSPQSHPYLDRRFAPGVTPPGRTEATTSLGFAVYRPRGPDSTVAARTPWA